MKRVVTIIQARMGSSRLPGKVMLDLCGMPLLQRMVERVRKSRLAGIIVVGTTFHPQDEPIVELCEKNNIECFRGHPEDLLDRHHQIALKYKADIVVKIPSDCPLIHHEIIDRVIGYYLEHEARFDYVSNLHPATYPDGNDVEVMSFSALEFAWMHANRPLEREHTTPFIWENMSLFRIGNVSTETGRDYSMTHRWTIDYEEDYQFIKSVFDSLYPFNYDFSTSEILYLVDQQQPHLKQVNQHLAGVNWYRHHLQELKTIDRSQTKQLEDVTK